MNCCGIILAAGASRRMGRVKALLVWEGETFLDRLTGAMGTVCREVVVVLGHHADAIRAGVRREARFVANPDPERGQLSSLQCALRAMRGDAEAFLFTPVDYPAIAESTMAQLRDALAAHPDRLIAVPRQGGKRGHPVACRVALAAEFLALPASARTSDPIHAHVGETIYVDVDDAGILTDIDDPQAYQALLASRA
ncbi:MAG: nucleotidyltransferase family protein [Bryobacterales bacterium]|nr:nucleotidyltransferase family protein [Bryobacterales bacterium]